MSWRTFAMVSLLSLGTLPAQTIHNVGPGGFAQIHTAIAAAAPGDVIVVQAGTYDPFTLNKGLTLTAAPGAVVNIAQPQVLGTVMTVFQIPAGQRAHVVGIRFRNPQQFLSFDLVNVLGGTIAFADCVFEGHASAMDPGLSVRQSDVVMQRCIVLGGAITNASAGYGGGGNDALLLDQSRLAASDCLFLGGSLNWDFGGDAGNGITASNSRLHLSHCTAMGGDNHAFNPGYPPGNGILVRPGATAWLADCLVIGGSGHTIAGAAGLLNLGTTPVGLARTTLGGGFGAPTGPASLGPTAPAPLLSVTTTGPLGRGTTWQVTYEATAGTPVLALLSDRLAPSLDARVVQPAWAGANATGVAFGIVGASGAITFPFAVPNAPSLLHAIVWLHGVAGTSLPL
ncbi:MAG: hypothetical protein Q7T30_00945, partial [Planctomycetota bacterium]|nr:hypothetical protein [Planctomycetota bacterium]